MDRTTQPAIDPSDNFNQIIGHIEDIVIGAAFQVRFHCFENQFTLELEFFGRKLSFVDEN